MSKGRCPDCYWWDVKRDEFIPECHTCHSPDTPPNYLSDASTICTFFRRRRHDDHEPWHKYAKKKKDPAAVKRGKSSKKKGKRGEKEFGERVCAVVGGRFYRQGDRASHRDAEFVDNCFEGVLHAEVKRHARFGMEKHCVQAEGDAATHGLSRWIVAWRPDGQTRWRYSGDLDDYLTDMQELHERRGKDGDE